MKIDYHQTMYQPNNIYIQSPDNHSGSIKLTDDKIIQAIEDGHDGYDFDEVILVKPTSEDIAILEKINLATRTVLERYGIKADPNIDSVHLFRTTGEDEANSFHDPLTHHTFLNHSHDPLDNAIGYAHELGHKYSYRHTSTQAPNGLVNGLVLWWPYDVEDPEGFLNSDDVSYDADAGLAAFKWLNESVSVQISMEILQEAGYNIGSFEEKIKAGYADDYATYQFLSTQLAKYLKTKEGTILQASINKWISNPPSATSFQLLNGDSKEIEKLFRLAYFHPVEFASLYMLIGSAYKHLKTNSSDGIGVLMDQSIPLFGMISWSKYKELLTLEI